MIYINNEKKLKRIKNEKDIFVITDFDRTLTTKESEPSMGIIPEYLGGKCLEERLKIFKHFRPIELDYTIDSKEKEKLMQNWARESFLLLSKYITKENIEESIINAKLHLREGAKNFLEELNNYNIPVIIMSSGIGNIVEAFLKKEDCLHSNYIVSNFFEFNDKPVIDFDNIMATSNKNYSRIPKKIRKIIENKDAGLLFGDLVEDIKMIDKKMINNTLTFGFLDENIENNLESFNKNFDIVLTEKGDFNDVKKLLNI